MKLYFDVCINNKYYDDFYKLYIEFLDKISKYRNENVYTDEDEMQLVDDINNVKKLIKFDDFDKKVKKEAILTPNDVNFVCIAGKFDNKLYSGRLMLLRTILSYEYLWTNIRVIGGAYGCMSVFSKLGNYAFMSYRDPNLLKTRDVYLGVNKFLGSFDKEDSQIEKYIIGTMGLYDNPKTTLEKHKMNVISYFNKFTNEMYDKERQEIMSSKISDIRNLCKYFKNIDNDASECALISSVFNEEAKTIYDDVSEILYE